MLTRLILCAIAVIIITLAACRKENEENLINKQGGPAACDTSNMKYTADILPILQVNCYECHGNGQQQIGVNFDTYDNIKKEVDNNRLISAIKHLPGYTPMPLGKPMLSSCVINKIQAWINNGAPEN